MQRTQSLTASGSVAEVRGAVERYLQQHRRAQNMQWIQPSTVYAELRSYAVTGGESLVVTFEASSDSEVQLEVTSSSAPLWDWGANARNLRQLEQYLKSAGHAVEGGPVSKKVGLNLEVPNIELPHIPNKDD